MYRVLASVCKYLSITNGFSWKPESGVSSTYPTILSIGKFGINITEFISCIRWEEHRWYLLLNFFSCFKWKYLLHFFLHLWLLVLDLLGRIIWKWRCFCLLISSIVFFSYRRPYCRRWRWKREGPTHICSSLKYNLWKFKYWCVCGGVGRY